MLARGQAERDTVTDAVQRRAFGTAPMTPVGSSRSGLRPAGA